MRLRPLNGRRALRSLLSRRLDAPSLRPLRLPRLRRGSFAPWLRPLVALTLRSLRLTSLSGRRFAPLWRGTLALRSFRLPPLDCRRLTLRLLALWRGTLALRSLRLPPLDCGRLTLRLLALWRGTLPLRFRRARPSGGLLLAVRLLLTRAWGRPRLRLLSGLLPTLFGALPLGRGGCGLLSGGQSAARRAWWVVKEAALLTRTQRLQLGRPG